MNKHHNQQGQILLIVILLSAVLLTVGLSISHIGVEDTRIAALQAEDRKALSGAEAGIDAALKDTSGQPIDISTLLPGANVSGTATVQSISQPSFVSPLIKRNDQYTFYTADYSNNTFTNLYNGKIVVYFQGGGTGFSSLPPALELTLISNTNTVTRSILEDSTDNRITGAAVTAVTAGSYTVNGTIFKYKQSISLSGTTQLIIARALFNDTRIALQTSGSPQPNLPLQGKTIVSTAQVTTSGVSKKVSLFQSYPQIPADFFVTSF